MKGYSRNMKVIISWEKSPREAMISAVMRICFCAFTIVTEELSFTLTNIPVCEKKIFSKLIPFSVKLA